MPLPVRREEIIQFIFRLKKSHHTLLSERADALGMKHTTYIRMKALEPDERIGADDTDAPAEPQPIEINLDPWEHE